jgi:hypothetical protein
MMDLTEAGLVQLARNFYPTGFPVTTDDSSQELPPFQRTPEYARWSEAWDRAMIWPEWKALKEQLRRSFENAFADSTQPRVAACRKCCVYIRHPLPHGTRQVTRVAVAASVLAPLYVIYRTTEIVVDAHSPSQDRRLSFELSEDVRPHAATLAALVERTLGYQAFPLQFAQVQVPGIRADHTHGDTAVTLLDALFDNHLESLF